MAWIPPSWTTPDWTTFGWLPEDPSGAAGPMSTTLTIGGVPLDGPARAAAGVFGLQFTWDLEACWSATFSVARTCNAGLPYVPGVPVTIAVDDGLGFPPRLVFVGDLQRPQGGPTRFGYEWHYTATDLKRRGDYVTLAGLDGSGTASFNLAPDDPDNLYALDGQTVGQIVAAILQAPTNAAALSAMGVGAYTSLSPPTLPAVTLSDLAAMMVVPPEPVQLSGPGILNLLEQFLVRWHPRYALTVLPDGTIRFRSIFALDPVAVALPASDGSGDDVDWPEIDGPDVSECYTAWEIVGLDVQTAYLSQAAGTLKPAWSSADQSSWTIADFLQPKEGKDTGDLSGLTGNSCTVHSDQATAHWVADFWNNPAVQGWIYLEWDAGTGIDIHEMRQVTSCTALAPGGSATVTWDAAQPISGTSYNRYRLVGLNTPRALVGRDFHVREPGLSATPPGHDLDLNTFVGSHLYPRNSKGMPVANSSRVFLVYYPYAFVQWSPTGKWPYFEVPVNVQLNPRTGHVILAEPAVLKSAGLAGTQGLLADHYPASYREGLYYDVQVVVPYNRGSISARSPASGFSGTAYTAYGIERTYVHRLDSYTWQGDTSSLQLLAAEHLACVRDAVVSGSIDYKELPTNYDCFTPGFALNVSVAGGSTPLDGLNLPVRSGTITWHDEGPTLYSFSARFSNLKRPFQGDSLYIHPRAGQGGQNFGMEGDSLFGLQGVGMANDMVSSMPSWLQGGDTMQSIAAANRQTMGGIAANHNAAAGEMFAQAHPGNAFAAQANQVNAGLAAQNAPVAAEFARQSQAGNPGDPFGVMQGMDTSGGGDSGRPPDRFLGPQERSRARDQQARWDRTRDPNNPLSIMGMELPPGGGKIDVDAPENPGSITNMRRHGRPGPKIDPGDDDTPPPPIPPADPQSPLSPPPTGPPRRPGGLASRRYDDDDTTSGGGG